MYHFLGVRSGEGVGQLPQREAVLFRAATTKIKSILNLSKIAIGVKTVWTKNSNSN